MKETVLQRIGKQIIRHPFYTALVIGILLSFAAWILVNPGSDNEIGNFLAVDFIFCAVFWFVGGLCGLTLQDRYITYLPEDICWHDSGRTILLKVAGTTVDATGDCFWGRGNIFEVTFPPYNFTVETSVTCTVSEYCKVHIPVTLEIDVDSGKPYDYQELYDKVILEAGVDSVEKYVKQLLAQPIVKNQQSLDYFARQHVNQIISSTTLLQKVASLLNFPEKALSNFTSFKLCLDNPTVRACKGSACTT
jgi:hypothetical protein